VAQGNVAELDPRGRANWRMAALIFLVMTINAWTRLGVAAKLTP
jgi:hypothetical protein